jgi:WD40 repeat protein
MSRTRTRLVAGSLVALLAAAACGAEQHTAHPPSSTARRAVNAPRRRIAPNEGARDAAASDAGPLPPCVRAAALRKNAKQLFDDGHYYRAVRSISAANDLAYQDYSCYSDVRTTWTIYVTAAAEVGLYDDAQSVASDIESAYDPPADDDQKAAAANARALMEARSRTFDVDKDWDPMMATYKKGVRLQAEHNADGAKQAFLDAWDQYHPNGKALIAAGLIAKDQKREKEASILFDRGIVDFGKESGKDLLLDVPSLDVIQGVRAVAWSLPPDDTQVALVMPSLAGTANELVVLDVTRIMGGDPRARAAVRVRVPLGEIDERSLQFSPDGKYVGLIAKATKDNPSLIALYDTQTGEAATLDISALAFAFRSTTEIDAYSNFKVQRWRWNPDGSGDRDKTKLSESDVYTMVGPPIDSATFAPNGSFVLLCRNGQSLGYLFRLSDSTTSKVYDACETPVRFTHDGAQMLAVGSSNELWSWKLDGPEPGTRTPVTVPAIEGDGPVEKSAVLSDGTIALLRPARTTVAPSQNTTGTSNKHKTDSTDSLSTNPDDAKHGLKDKGDDKRHLADAGADASMRRGATDGGANASGDAGDAGNVGDAGDAGDVGDASGAKANGDEGVEQTRKVVRLWSPTLPGYLTAPLAADDIIGSAATSSGWVVAAPKSGLAFLRRGARATIDFELEGAGATADLAHASVALDGRTVWQGDRAADGSWPPSNGVIPAFDGAVTIGNHDARVDLRFNDGHVTTWQTKEPFMANAGQIARVDVVKAEGSDALDARQSRTEMRPVMQVGLNVLETAEETEALSIDRGNSDTCSLHLHAGYADLVLGVRMTSDGGILKVARARDRIVLEDMTSTTGDVLAGAGWGGLATTSAAIDLTGNTFAIGAADGVLLGTQGSTDLVELLDARGDAWPTPIAIRDDGAVLATIGTYDRLILWDTRTAQQIAELKAPGLTSMAFSSDGSRLYFATAGNDDGTNGDGTDAFYTELHVYDVATRTTSHLFTRRKPCSIDAIAVRPGTRELAVARVAEVTIVDEGGALLQTINAGSPVRAVGWNKEGQKLVTAGFDGVVKVWSLDDLSSPVLTLTTFLVPDEKGGGDREAQLVGTPNMQRIDLDDDVIPGVHCRIGYFTTRFDVCADRFRARGLAHRLLVGETSYLDP